MSTEPAAEKPPAALLLEMITGHWAARVVHVAAKLGLADRLKEGPLAADALAAEVEADPSCLYRLLRCLAGLGVLRQDEEERFHLTPVSELLLSDAPDSLRYLAMMYGEEQFRAWEDLHYSVKTGKTAFEHVFRQPFFEYYASHPEAAEIRNRGLAAASRLLIRSVVEACDFSRYKTVVDIGGGSGELLSEILKAYPKLQGVLFELPETVGRARRCLEANGVLDRCELLGGDFFFCVPEDGDAYVLAHIIHDWNDEDSVKILRNCREAMNARSRLYIVEKVIPPANVAHLSKLDDVNMMVLTGGRERTEQEYRSLLEKTNLRFLRTIATASPASVVEAAAA